MPKFIIYEVWTRATEVHSPDLHSALSDYDPDPVAGMSLSNWHAYPVTPCSTCEDADLIPETNG